VIKRIYHVNVNVTDIERSIVFYQKFGFKVSKRAETNNPGLQRAMATKSARVRWAHLHIGEDPNLTRIDLVQWLDGPKKAPPRKSLDEPGIGRFSLITDDIFKEYDRLKGEGVQFLSPPDKGEGPHGTFYYCVAIDPDNTNVQLVQPPPSAL
jgi:catechol 2,3-dioxygenase-like lactoylglutathione lyase family enzyme